MALIDSPVGIFSCWIQLFGINTFIFPPSRGIIWQSFALPGDHNIGMFTVNSTDNKFSIILSTAVIPGTTHTIIDSTNGSMTPIYTSGIRTWKHVLASWDLSGPSFTGSIYINDVFELATVSPYNSGNVRWASQTGGRIFNSTSTGMLGFIGSFVSISATLAHVYLNTQEYLDFSIVSNRRKFISSLGEYVSLGSNGELPTGNSPSYFFEGNIFNFPINKGTETNLSVSGSGIVNGIVNPPGLPGL